MSMFPLTRDVDHTLKEWSSTGVFPENLVTGQFCVQTMMLLQKATDKLEQTKEKLEMEKEKQSHKDEKVDYMKRAVELYEKLEKKHADELKGAHSGKDYAERMLQDHLDEREEKDRSLRPCFVGRKYKGISKQRMRTGTLIGYRKETAHYAKIREDDTGVVFEVRSDKLSPA